MDHPFRVGVFTVVGMLLASHATAKTFRYLCEVPPHPSGYITASYVLDVDTTANTVAIQDGLSNAATGKPVSGEIAEMSSAKHVFKWELVLRSSNGQTVKMRYRAAVFLSTMLARIEAVPIGYSSRFQKRGACRVVE
jgi:hypothetical protein